MKVSLLEIFWTFLKIGCLIFGGGVVIIPLLEAEAVKKKGWLTSDELVEFYAISQVIPGINIPDVAMFVGYKLRGKIGATVAGFGVIFVPFILIVSVAAFLNIISGLGIVKSALWGIEIGTIIVIITTVKSIWAHSIVDKFTLFLFIFILGISLANISPVWIVVFALSLGIIKGFLVKRKAE